MTNPNRDDAAKASIEPDETPSAHPASADDDQHSSGFFDSEDWEIDYDYCEQQPIRKTSWPFKCLGHDQGKYFFLAAGSNQIVQFKPSGLIPANLFSLADKEWFYKNFPKISDEGKSIKIDFESAINAIIQKCHAAGVFNPDQRQRGAGVWRDKKSIVVHCGDRLLCGGKEYTAFNFESHYIYEQAEKRFDVSEEALSDIEAQKLLKICTKITWKNSLSGKILAGWIIMAMMCGCLKWRPHLWLMGVFGSGKSFVINDLLARALVGIAKVLGSGSTEAGIRQKIRHDALPVIMDEMDAESPKDNDLIQAILMMSRRSSSGQTIAKGTAEGIAQEYNLMSMFCFASINHRIAQGADESRISILEITKDESINAAQDFRDLEIFTQETLTPDFSRRLLRRVINNLPAILKNIEIFKRHLRDLLKDARAADQLAPFMAGVYLLNREGIISEENAQKWVVDPKNNMRSYTATDTDRDHERLFDFLISSKISVKTKHASHDVQIGKAITVALGREIAEFSDADAQNALDAIDIRVRSEIWIKQNSQHIKNILKGTPWAVSWKKTLLLNPAVSESVEKHRIGQSVGIVLLIDNDKFKQQ